MWLDDKRGAGLRYDMEPYAAYPYPIKTGSKGDLISEAGVVNVLERNVSSCYVKKTENCWWDGFAITHTCDIVPGHSGGPIFLSGTPAVAIGVQSSENKCFDENIAAGGPEFVKLCAKWTAKVK